MFKWITFYLKTLLFVSLIAAPFPADLLANKVPMTINLEAILENKGGLLEGEKRVVVSLQDGVNEPQWKEAFKDVLFSNGVFSVVLGN